MTIMVGGAAQETCEEKRLAQRIEADVVFHAHPDHGEGPVWDDRDASLVWVDISGRAVHRYRPATGEDDAVAVGQPVGAAVPRESGGLVVAVENGFGFLDGDEPLELFAPVEADDPGIRFNDAKCDPAGRLWAGTMAYDETQGAATLYRLDPDHRVETIVTDLTISNGMAWSSDRQTMYFIDTPTAGVDAFDYDIDTGTIRNRRRVVDLSGEQGLPDGMTIDADDGLWVAMWGGWQVRRYRPDGALDGTVSLPVGNVTSCAFGGPAFEDLYITTSPEGLTDSQRAAQPLAGALFRCRPGIPGLPADRFRG